VAGVSSLRAAFRKVRLWDLSAVAFSESAAALSVTLSQQTVGLLTVLIQSAVENRYLWASSGGSLSDAEEQALTEALDTAYMEIRIDDETP
jgi:hypothetical protein